MKLAAFRHPDDPESTRRAALVVGQGRDVWLHPFPDGVEIVPLLATDLDEREAAADKAAESYGLRLDEVVVLPPVDPAAVRGFAAFEPDGDADPDSDPAYRLIAPDTVVGPFDDVQCPSATERLDFGLGLAAVVCRDVSDATPNQALDAIGGYCVVDDWSAADQPRNLPTTLGPWVVTTDELDGHRDAEGALDLAMSVRVNGRRVGADVSGHMRWTFEQLLTHASRSASVRAGEVLTSGTCRHGSLAGARPASGRREPSPLKPGDVVEMTIEGIGTIRNRISRPADTRDLVTSEREHPA